MRSSVDLPGAVGADETDDVAGGDDEVEAGEQLAIAEPGPHVLGLDGCGHAVILLARRRCEGTRAGRRKARSFSSGKRFD